MKGFNHDLQARILLFSQGGHDSVLRSPLPYLIPKGRGKRSDVEFSGISCACINTIEETGLKPVSYA